MEKKQEIEILKALKGDTYFNQFFSNEDIDQMCLNISNDFPIELDCKFMEAEEKLKSELAKVKSSSEDQLRKCSETAQTHLEEFARGIIVELGDDFGYPIYDSFEEEFGIGFIIKTKLEHDIELTSDEKKYIASKL